MDILDCGAGDEFPSTVLRGNDCGGGGPSSAARGADDEAGGAAEMDVPVAVSKAEPCVSSGTVCTDGVVATFADGRTADVLEDDVVVACWGGGGSCAAGLGMTTGRGGVDAPGSVVSSDDDGDGNGDEEEEEDVCSVVVESGIVGGPCGRPFWFCGRCPCP